MATLYLRNVPDDVGERLGRLAARAGMSVSAFAVRELTESSRRALNADLLDGLADHEIDPAQIVADLAERRGDR